MSSTPPDNLPRPRESILSISPYIPGKSGSSGVATRHKLSSNETPLGPSPKAVEAFSAAAAKLADYPDGAASKLREAIAARYGLNPGHIVCGSGSDELLNLIAQGYLSPGDEAIYSQHGFLVYRIATLAAGGTPVVAPETNLTSDIDAILSCVTPRTKIVFLANPNNPTGTYLPFEEVRRLHKGLPPHVLLVLDAAYAEYVRRNDYESGLSLVAESGNVIMTRTFSKIHGLGGLRSGWGYARREIIDVLNRVRQPFNLSEAQMAAATAAVRDVDYTRWCASENARWRDWLRNAFLQMGIGCDESHANFLLARFADADEAGAVDAALKAEGILVRRVAGYGIPEGLRITVGDEVACRRVVDVIARFKGVRG